MSGGCSARHGRCVGCSSCLGHFLQTLADSTCRFVEPSWLHDRNEPFLQRRDRLPEPAEEPPKLGIRNFVSMDLSTVGLTLLALDSPPSG